MDLAELHGQTLAQLQEIERRMSADALNGADPRADRLLVQVQQCRLKLENADLESIADRLKTNEAELILGTKKVRKALEELTEFDARLDAISSFTSIVAKVLPLALGV